MDVTISGAKDRELTKILRLATYSFSKNLFSPRLASNLKLDIRIKDKLDAGGYCIGIIHGKLKRMVYRKA